MRLRFALLTVLMMVCPLCGFSDEPPAAKKKPAERAENDIRKPGFLFLELTVSDFEGNIKFLEDVAGYHVVRKEKNFVILQTELGEILLNGTGAISDNLANRVPGLEVGLVVADIKATHAAAEKTGWRITDRIQRQPWGVRDFRVLSPDGYYLRFTE